jgi:hypothetical protein
MLELSRITCMVDVFSILITSAKRNNHPLVSPHLIWLDVDPALTTKALDSDMFGPSSSAGIVTSKSRI